VPATPTNSGPAVPALSPYLSNPDVSLPLAKLIALACSTPPEGYARWTLQMLEGKVVELNIVTRASDNTIGRTLKKTFSSRT